jgi:hypothetical protein
MPRVTRTLRALCALGLIAAPLAAQRSRVITAEEIERVRPNVGTAYDAVQTLRPRWLGQAREVLSLPRNDSDMRMARLHVYLNDRDMGGVEFLKSIPAAEVDSLSWLSTIQAGARFGPSEGPAIVVTLKALPRRAPP